MANNMIVLQTDRHADWATNFYKYFKNVFCHNGCGRKVNMNWAIKHKYICKKCIKEKNRAKD